MANPVGIHQYRDHVLLEKGTDIIHFESEFQVISSFAGLLAFSSLFATFKVSIS